MDRFKGLIGCHSKDCGITYCQFCDLKELANECKELLEMDEFRPLHGDNDE